MRWFIDTWSRIIRIDLLEESSVDQDPTINRYLNRLPFLYEKGAAMAVAVVGASQGNEL